MRENSGKIDLLIGKTDTNKENEEFDNGHSPLAIFNLFLKIFKNMYVVSVDFL
jgi:hypothetical protein